MRERSVGIIGGALSRLVAAAFLARTNMRVPHPRLFLAGETVFPGPGTLSAALSDHFAARAVAGSRVRRP